MFETLPPLVQSILSAILIALGGALTAYLVYVLFARLTNRYIGSLLALLIIFGTLKWILDVADAVGLVVILGTALTGALTLGMDDLATDLVSGTKLFATRPFRIGDTVAIAGHFGKVTEITLTNTVLLSTTGHQIIVRNSEVVAGTITNYSSGSGEQRIEVEVNIPASQDLETIVTALLEGTKDFTPPTISRVGVLCESVSDAQMTLKVYGFTTGNQDMDAEKTRLMVATLRALKNHNVSL
jgi:small-conductance mechanosensitive channel